MKSKQLAATAVALAALTSPSSAETVWRLFVSDHAAPVVRSVDLTGAKEIRAFAVTGPAGLQRTESGRLVFAIQGAAGTVSAIATGVALDDHGDHGDIEISDPRLSGFEIAGTKPSHVVDHDGQVAVFFDGEGVTRNFVEASVFEGKPAITEVATAAPHHGVSVAYGRHVLLSEPDVAKPDALPVGIRTVDAAGNQVGDVAACPDLHGEASSGDILAFACATGLLIVRNGVDGPAIEHLPYDDALPEGKTTTLLGGKGLQYFLGNYGPEKVVLIDPRADGDKFRLIDLPVRRVHFAVDPVRPKFAYVITEDGRLHRLDVMAGAIVDSLALTEPYSMDGHWSDPRPRIAVAGDSIVVTDPLKGMLRLIDAASFQAAGEIALEGKPFNIVAVGGSGEAHKE